MKRSNSFLYFILILWAIVMAVALSSCTKTHTTVQMRAKITRNADTLTASGWSTAGKITRYVWFNNLVRSEGQTLVIGKGRNDVQMVVFDEAGNNTAEYEIYTKQ